jgi:hypothetical protein
MSYVHDWLTKLIGMMDVASVFGATVLVMMSTGLAVVFYIAQKRPDVDVAQFLRDENGKLSASRLAVFVALLFSSWALVVDTLMNRQVDATVYLIYLGTWSTSKTLEAVVSFLVQNKIVGKLVPPVTQASVAQQGTAQ